MTAYVQNTFDYVDGGVVIKKQTWYDPMSGQTWDTFDPQGPAESGLGDGTVVNQPSNQYANNPAAVADYNQSQIPPSMQPGNNPTGLQGATYNDGQRTSGTNTPQSGVGVTPMAPPAQTGGNPGSPQATNPGNMWQQGGTVDPNLTNQQRNMFLYNPSNPTGAMANVLRGMGLNPGVGANPFENMLMRYAPGLGSAFNIANVNKNRSDIPADIGNEFASFISRNLQGQGGSMAGTFADARSGIGSALDTIQQSFGQNQGAQVSPFVEALKAMFDANGTGMGLASTLQGLASPFLTPQMGQAYGQGLQGATNRGLFDWASGPEFGTSAADNYWIKALYNGG